MDCIHLAQSRIEWYGEDGCGTSISIKGGEYVADLSEYHFIKKDSDVWSHRTDQQVSFADICVGVFNSVREVLRNVLLSFLWRY
jgi:hypothetical protein